MPNKFSYALVPDISQYDLKFTEPDGVMRLHVLEARDLERKDINLIGKGKSDPYCIVRIGARQHKTRVIKGTITPKWDEWFESVVDQVSGQQVEIELFDEDMGANDELLGRVSFDAMHVAKQGSIDQWFTLEDVKSGQLRLRAFWLGLSAERRALEASIRDALTLTEKAPLSSALLMVYVDSAQDLPIIKRSPMEPCPYLQLTCGKASAKTFTCYSTTNPVWEHQESFIVHDPRIDVLRVEVKDEKTSKTLGWLELPLTQLIEKDGMSMDAPFPLRDSGAESQLRLRLRLRILEVASVKSGLGYAEDDVDTTAAESTDDSFAKQSSEATESGQQSGSEAPIAKGQPRNEAPVEKPAGSDAPLVQLAKADSTVQASMPLPQTSRSLHSTDSESSLRLRRMDDEPRMRVTLTFLGAREVLTGKRLGMCCIVYCICVYNKRA